jgi:hypothetical protein
MGDAQYVAPDQGLQTRRMWRFSAIVFTLLVLCVGWFLFYDGPPPDDEKMLPRWTMHDPGKPNPWADFLAGLDIPSMSKFDKLFPRVMSRPPGCEPEIRENLALQHLNLAAFDQLLLTDPATWRWPAGEKMTEVAYDTTIIGPPSAVAQMQRFRIHLLKFDGKMEEAVAHSLNLSRFGSGVQSTEGLLHPLFSGLMWQRLGEDALQDVLAGSSASPELLRKTLHQLQAIPLPSRADMQFAHKVEYLTFKNAVQKLDYARLADPVGTYRGSAAAPDPIKQFLYKKNRTLSGRLELDRPVVEALDRDWAEAYAAAIRAGEFSAAYKPKPVRGGIGIYLDPNFGGTSLLAMNIDSSGTLIARAMSVDALKRQTELMLAMRLFELEKGRLPAKLEELVPDYGASIPVDVFTGKAMLWNATLETVYSVGPGGVDDGGAIDPKRPPKGADVGMRYWWSKLPPPPTAATKP